MRFTKKVDKPATEVQATAEKQVTVEGKAVTVDDLLRVINALGEQNKSQFLEAAERMAFNIAHPPPTQSQKEAQLANLASRAEMAKEADATKSEKRLHCVEPADPNFPHRRAKNRSNGIFGGETVVGWMYSQPSIKTLTGSKDGPLTAFGVCQWCGTEFKPGDPDYAEALSWGMTQSYGSFPMNRSNGQWGSGTR